ncbi:MAG: DUF58 domain-containing protein [Bdellovibrionaceae bacterium]|nr:DUF58 domain-containing protein [Pseudobdellovibrionaceae bacterium]
MVKNWLKKFFKAPRFLSKYTPDRNIKKQKRPYIIPSRFGVYFGSGILVLIALAYTYANQLIYLIAFFYSSVLFIAMHLTNNNIKSIEISELFVPNFFQDETGILKITLHNNHSKYSARFLNIDIIGYGLTSVVTEIPPNSFQTTEMILQKRSRGKYHYPKVTLSSKFPFNLFYSWKRLTWDQEFFVYPAREGHADPPYSSEDELSKKLDLTSARLDSQSDNFLGHKEYTAYENYKRIDWKVYARKNKLYVKTFETESSKICYIDFSEYFRNVGDFEKRINQLTKWIFDSQKWNTLFVVKLSNDEVTFLDDRKKFESLLEKLSVFRIQDLT